MNIYQKMLEATKKINTVAKNLSVKVGTGSYKAVSEADVLAAVKPIEAELGIYSYPFSRKIIESKEFIVTSAYGGNSTEKTSIFLRLETVYRFINTEDTKEFIDIITYGDGIDSQDKSPGKAMTYADKYALLKAYKIETGEDPDQEPSGSLKPKNTERSSESPKPKHTQEIPKSNITPEQQEKVGALNINLAKLAVYNKTQVELLSEEQIDEAIKLKEDNLAKKKEKENASRV